MINFKHLYSRTLIVLFVCLLTLSLSILAKSETQILQTKLSVELLTKTTQSWDSTPLPTYPIDRPEITAIKVTIPPNTYIATHKHQTISFGYVVKGKLTVISEDKQELELGVGDTIIEMVEQWHSAKNTASEPVELIVFYLGPTAHPLATYKD